MEDAYESNFYDKNKTLEITPPTSFEQYGESTSMSGINQEGQKLYDVTMVQDYADIGMGTCPSSDGRDNQVSVQADENMGAY